MVTATASDACLVLDALPNPLTGFPLLKQVVHAFVGFAVFLGQCRDEFEVAQLLGTHRFGGLITLVFGILATAVAIFAVLFLRVLGVFGVFCPSSPLGIICVK